MGGFEQQPQHRPCDLSFVAQIRTPIFIIIEDREIHYYSDKEGPCTLLDFIGLYKSCKITQPLVQSPEGILNFHTKSVHVPFKHNIKRPGHQHQLSWLLVLKNNAVLYTRNFVLSCPFTKLSLVKTRKHFFSTKSQLTLLYQQ